MPKSIRVRMRTFFARCVPWAMVMTSSFEAAFKALHHPSAIVQHSAAPQMPTRAYRPCLGFSHLVSKVLEFFELLDECLSSDAQNT